MIQGAIFDLDGTLADTMDDLQTAMNQMLVDLGYPTRSREELISFINKGARVFVAKSLPESEVEDYNSPLVNRGLEIFRGHYAKCYADRTHAYPGIVAQLEALKEKGIAMGVLSNKPEEFVKVLVDKLFPGFFTSVHGQNAVMPAKPDPTAAYLCAEELGVRPEDCAFVGDSDVDMTTGLNAGMHTVGVAWGYRDQACLTAAGAHVIIQETADIQRILLEL
jgi:phosphoglycolate phosphatase